MTGCSVCTCRRAPWSSAGRSRSTGWHLQRCDNLTQARRTGYYRHVLHCRALWEPSKCFCPLLGKESALDFVLKAHLSDSSFPAVSSAKTPDADLSMIFLWMTGSSSQGQKHTLQDIHFKHKWLPLESLFSSTHTHTHTSKVSWIIMNVNTFRSSCPSLKQPSRI